MLLVYILDILSTEKKFIDEKIRCSYKSDTLNVLNTSRISQNNDSTDKCNSHSSDLLDEYKMNQNNKFDVGTDDINWRCIKSKDICENDFMKINYRMRSLNENMDYDKRDISQGSHVNKKPGSCRIVGYTEKDTKNFVSIGSDPEHRLNYSFNLSRMSVIPLDVSKGNFFTDNIKSVGSDEKNKSSFDNNQTTDLSFTKESKLIRDSLNSEDSKSIDDILILKESESFDEIPNIKYFALDQIGTRNHIFKFEPGIFDDTMSIDESGKSSSAEGSYSLDGIVYNDDSSSSSRKRLSSSGRSLYGIRNSSRLSLLSLSSRKSLTNLLPDKVDGNFLNLEVSIVESKSDFVIANVKLIRRDVYKTIYEILRALLNDKNQMTNFIKLVKKYNKKKRKLNLKAKIRCWLTDNKKEIIEYLKKLKEDIDPVDRLIPNEKIAIFHSDMYIKIMNILKSFASEKSKESVIKEGKYTISLHYLMMHTLLNYINKKLI
jgi:hypothetical protein